MTKTFSSFLFIFFMTVLCKTTSFPRTQLQLTRTHLEFGKTKIKLRTKKDEDYVAQTRTQT